MTIILDGTTGITTPAINSSGDLELPGGTANGVLYLNGSKIATSGSALVFDGANLGVGVTPSAWALSGSAGFQVKNASLAGYANNAYVGANQYFNSGGGSNYIADGFASMYTQTSGKHEWASAASGTAGNAITFGDPKMTLTADGDLALGVSSPRSGYRLDIRESADNGVNIQAGDGGTDIALSIGSAGTADKFVFTAGGDFGIGTTSPGAKLDIAVAGVASARIENTASTSDAYLIFKNTAGQSYFGVNATGPYIYTATAQAMVFHTNNTERARIDSSGNFIIGNTSPITGGTKLTVYASHNDWLAGIRNSNASPRGLLISHDTDSNGTANWFLYCEGASNQRMSVRSNGGIANYSANDANLSDERVKTDIAPLGSMWDKFKAIEIVTFKYKDQEHDDDNIGVIAQQVESVAPEFVDVDGWDDKVPEDGVPLKSIYTTDMYHAAIKALQEAMTRIEALEAEVAALKGV